MSDARRAKKSPVLKETLTDSGTCELARSLNGRAGVSAAAPQSSWIAYWFAASTAVGEMSTARVSRPVVDAIWIASYPWSAQIDVRHTQDQERRQMLLCHIQGRMHVQN